jgi:hypothetical protein
VNTNPITKLDGFSRLDRERAILLLVWEAREYLSDAERGKSTPPRVRIDACGEAHRLLDAALVLTSPQMGRVRDWLKRARFAASAAAENGEIAASYALASANAKATEWELLRAPKALALFERAAETARGETHRALAELCETFPNAIPKE